jgi:hypothetical protein
MLLQHAITRLLLARSLWHTQAKSFYRIELPTSLLYMEKMEWLYLATSAWSILHLDCGHSTISAWYNKYYIPKRSSAGCSVDNHRLCALMLPGSLPINELVVSGLVGGYGRPSSFLALTTLTWLPFPLQTLFPHCCKLTRAPRRLPGSYHGHPRGQRHHADR